MLSTLFCIHDLTHVCDWLVLLWMRRHRKRAHHSFLTESTEPSWIPSYRFFDIMVTWPSQTIASAFFATSHRATWNKWSLEAQSATECIYNRYDVPRYEVINDEPMLYCPGENTPGTESVVSLKHAWNNKHCLWGDEWREIIDWSQSYRQPEV